MLQILIELCPEGSGKNRDTNGTNDINACGTNAAVNSHEENGVVSKKHKGSKHIVIINVSPLEYCNVLLVPNVDDCLPQVGWVWALLRLLTFLAS